MHVIDSLLGKVIEDSLQQAKEYRGREQIESSSEENSEEFWLRSFI